MNLIKQYSDEQLTAIEEMAANGFTISEIAEVVVPDDQDAFAIDANIKEGIIFKSYRKGILKSQLELRQRIFKDAKHGSSPAQALAKKILDDAEYKLNQ